MIGFHENNHPRPKGGKKVKQLKDTKHDFKINGIKISISPKPMTAYGGFSLLAIFFREA